MGNKIKLTEWAQKRGISYLKANRYFHAGNLPNAEQTSPGAPILVDEDEEITMNKANSANELWTSFVNKTMEFHQNRCSMAEFIGFVVSNFETKPTSQEPKYSKKPPPREEVNKHFDKLMSPFKDKEEKLKHIQEQAKKTNNTNNQSIYQLNPDSTTFKQALENLDKYAKSLDNESEHQLVEKTKQLIQNNPMFDENTKQQILENINNISGKELEYVLSNYIHTKQIEQSLKNLPFSDGGLFDDNELDHIQKLNNHLKNVLPSPTYQPHPTTSHPKSFKRSEEENQGEHTVLDKGIINE